MSARTASIRGRLVVGVVATLAAGMTAGAAHVWWDLREEMRELFDARLAESARLLLAQAEHELREWGGDPPAGDGAAGEGGTAGRGDTDDSEDSESDLDHTDGDDEDGSDGDGPDLGLHHYEGRLVFEVINGDGRPLYRSGRERLPASPGADRPPKPGAAGAERAGFHTLRAGEASWRVFSLWNGERDLLVRVGERLTVRDRLAREIAWTVLAPIAWTLLPLAALAWIVLSRGLAPLRRLAGEIASRQPANLEPFLPAPVPAEVKPVVDALNDLMGRLRAALERERQFTGDAAHELRTPLAGVRAQAEAALAAPRPEETRRCLGLVIAGVDRTSHLIDQLLTLARLDPEEPLAAPSGGRPALSVLGAVLADLAPLADAKGVELSLEGEPDLLVACEDGLLALVARNLVDNAIRYTAPQTQVAVKVHRNGTTVLIEVSDQGPGIPAADRERCFDRFYRHPGTASGTSGAGLGLAIVRRVVARSGGSVTLRDGAGGRGLTVSVALPVASPV